MRSGDIAQPGWEHPWLGVPLMDGTKELGGRGCSSSGPAKLLSGHFRFGQRMCEL